MKDTKIKIKMGHDKLTAEDISKGKNFTKLYKSYTTMKTNWYKNPTKLGGFVTVVVTVTTIVTYSAWKYNSKSAPVKKAVTVADATTRKPADQQVKPNFTRYVNPPVKGLDVPYKSYKVNAEKGGEIKCEKGSKISIPKNAFCDKNGKDIKGDVTIQYREFHNPIDFFLSGIPMTYDSAGQQYTFASAGMLDINGFKNGEPVTIKNGKDIKVLMASYGKGTKYNMYSLDTVVRKWVYIDKSAPVQAPAQQQQPTRMLKDTSIAEQKEVAIAKNEVAKIQQEEKKLEEKKPLQPQKADAKLFSFDIEADAREFPEMSAYKNVLFQVDPNDKNFEPKYSKITWEDATLNRSGTGNNYNFTVKKGTESHTFIVHPVFDDKHYAEASKEYDKKYQEYETALSNRKAEEKKQEEAYAALVKKQEEEAKKAQEAYTKQLLASSTESGVMNTFTIKRFGVYNCDCPQMCPQGAALAATYTDQNNKELTGVS
ncbi:MAG TPA: hypothetical protein VNZ45_07180, partial [Bacteroidia bacterium]|nr:hypothetical protein [Bacteroidia bacterium]